MKFSRLLGLVSVLSLLESGIRAEANLCTDLLDPFRLFTSVEKSTDKVWKQIKETPPPKNKKFDIQRFYDSRAKWTRRIDSKSNFQDWNDVRLYTFEDQIGFLEALTSSRGVFDLSLEKNLGLARTEPARRMERVKAILDDHQFGWSYMSKNEIERMTGKLYDTVLGRTGRAYNYAEDGFRDAVDASMGRAIQERLFRQSVYKVFNEMGLARDPTFLDRTRAFFSNEKVRIAISVAINALNLQKLRLALPLVMQPGFRLDRWIKYSDEELFHMFTQKTGNDILHDLTLDSLNGSMRKVNATAVFNISSRTVSTVLVVAFAGYFAYTQVTSEVVEKPSEGSDVTAVEAIRESVQAPPDSGVDELGGVSYLPPLGDSLWQSYLQTQPDPDSTEYKETYKFIYRK